MNFYEVLDQVIDLLRRRGRVAYRALKMQFNLDDDAMEALKDDIIKAQRLAVDEDGDVLVWTGGAESAPLSAADPVRPPKAPPLAYTPSHLTEKILTSRSALEGERKQVTVLPQRLQTVGPDALGPGKTVRLYPCIFNLSSGGS
jgi:hypothetical protein